MPLGRMHMFEKPRPTVTLQIGDTKLGPYEVTREQFPGLPPGDAPHVVFRVGMAPDGQGAGGDAHDGPDGRSPRRPRAR